MSKEHPVIEVHDVFVIAGRKYVVRSITTGKTEVDGTRWLATVEFQDLQSMLQHEAFATEGEYRVVQDDVRPIQPPLLTP